MILSPLIKFREFDANGLPLIGGLLYSYVAGTTTPQATYTDQSGNTPNSNPVVLDSSGRASIWVDPTLAYKFVLNDALGNLIYTVDQVSNAGSAGADTWNPDSIYSQGAIVADSSGAGLFYVSLQDNNEGNALTNVSYWRIQGGGTRTLTSSTTLAITDEIVRSNSTGGNLTHTLPPCSTTPVGKRITIKDVGTGGNTTQVKGSGSDNVDGANTYATALRANESITAENTGSAWDVVLSYITPDGSISTAKIATGAVTQAKLAARATGSTVGVGGVAVGASSGGFSTASTSLTDVGITIQITTSGRPVMVALQSAGTDAGLHHSASGSGSAAIVIKRGSTIISAMQMGVASGQTTIPASSVSFLDIVAAGTYTYDLFVNCETFTEQTINVTNCALMAYEL